VFCTKCGTDNKTEAKFCKSCGAGLSAAAASSPAGIGQAGPPPPLTLPVRVSPELTRWLTIGGIALVVLFAGLKVWTAFGPSPHFKLAKKAVARGDWASASSYLEIELHKHEDNAEARFLSGQCQLYLCQQGRADSEFKKLLFKHPDFKERVDALYPKAAEAALAKDDLNCAVMILRQLKDPVAKTAAATQLIEAGVRKAADTPEYESVSNYFVQAGALDPNSAKKAAEKAAELAATRHTAGFTDEACRFAQLAQSLDRGRYSELIGKYCSNYGR